MLAGFSGFKVLDEFYHIEVKYPLTLFEAVNTLIWAFDVYILIAQGFYRRVHIQAMMRTERKKQSWKVFSSS